jgi:uncharacterized protein (DUF849 family)
MMLEHIFNTLIFENNPPNLRKIYLGYTILVIKLIPLFMKPLIINFTPTGMIPRKSVVPGVPESPNEIVEQVHEAFELGITLVHLHARNTDGTPTYKKSIYSEIIEGIRKHCPTLVICTSLSGRNFPEFEKRSEPIELYPDMASLTLSSLNFVQQASINSPDMIVRLAEKMKLYGVKPELEVFDFGMINYAQYLINKKIIQPPFYYNIILGNIASAQMDLTQAGVMIKSLPASSFWSLGGIGRFQLGANLTAIANDGGVRVGLEDNTIFDYNNQKVATNIALIRRIHDFATLAGRPVMKSKDFGDAGFYNSNK